MSVRVRAADSADADAIVAFLHNRMNDRWSPTKWRRILDYPWLEDKPDLGQVAVDGDRVVGFVGGLYADREIGGRRERLCNMSSVYVDKTYRGRGLGFRLLEKLTADREVTYFVFDPSPAVVPVLTRAELDFSVLEAERCRWRAAGAAARDADVVQILEPADGLAAKERRLVADHQAFRVRAYRLRAEGRAALILLWAKPPEAESNFYDVLYVGDRAAFARHGQALANAILRGDDALLVADRRFADGVPQGAAVERLRAPRYFKSPRLAPPQIDHLYSEIPLLDLTIS